MGEILWLPSRITLFGTPWPGFGNFFQCLVICRLPDIVTLTDVVSVSRETWQAGRVQAGRIWEGDGAHLR